MSLVVISVLVLLACPILSWCAANGDVREVRLTAKSRFVTPEFRNVEEWDARRESVRRQILGAAGLWPLPHCDPVQFRRTLSFTGNEYTVEKVVFESLPGFYVGGNLYLPRAGGARHPGVLVPHGHWKRGRVHNAPDYSVPALCANLATQGFVAFTWDMVGYNDTRQLPHEFGNSRTELLWSFTPLGIQLWNAIRATDLLQSLPEVDPDRIAITGASGGATQSILLAAVDSRLKAAAPVGMVSANFQGDDTCETAPGLRRNTNNVEIAAMMAPRPLLLVSATGDWTKDTPEVEFPTIRSIYRLYGANPEVGYVQIDSGHNYNKASREAVYDFLNRYLGDGGQHGAIAERPLALPEAENLLWGPAMPKDFGQQSPKGIFDAWQELVKKRFDSLSAADCREQLKVVLGIESPGRVNAIMAGDHILLEGEGSGERVGVRWQPGRGQGTAVLIHPEGMDHAARLPIMSSLIKRGLSILHVEPFESRSEASSSRQQLPYLTFQRSDDANRIQDILVATSYERDREPQSIPRLVCPGRAGIWCLLAAAVSDRPMIIECDRRSFGGTTQDLFLPGFELAGGLEAALRAGGFQELSGTKESVELRSRPQTIE